MVAIYNRGERLVETGLDCLLYALAKSNFLSDSREDDYIGIDRHAHRENNAGNTRQRHRDIECADQADREADIKCQREGSSETRQPENTDHDHSNREEADCARP